MRVKQGRESRMQDDKHEGKAGPCDRAVIFAWDALLLQERWVLRIVFSLLFSPRGFSELMRRGNINTTTLI